MIPIFVRFIHRYLANLYQGAETLPTIATPLVATTSMVLDAPKT
jgi:hypothetical protein